MSIKGKQFLKRMKTRLLIIFFAAVIFFAVLVARVIYISVAKGQEYQEEVLDQKSYDSLDIPFERGDIVDRNGNVLATSEKVYNLADRSRQESNKGCADKIFQHGRIEVR